MIMGLSNTAEAYHGELFPECPDIEENGAPTNSINGGSIQYVELAPEQTKHTVTSVGTASGHCEIWGKNRFSEPCSIIREEDAYIYFLGIYSKSIPRDRWLLRAGDNGNLGQSATETFDLSPGVHYLQGKTLGWDTICDLLEPNPVRSFATVYVNTHPPKEEHCPNNADVNIGNPCDASTGNKSQQEVDYDSSIHGMKIVRTYNSKVQDDYGLGVGWSAPFLKRLDIGFDVIRMRRANGSSESVVQDNGAWKPGLDGTLTLTQDSSGYHLTLSNGDHENYDLSGRILDEEVGGYTLTYTYDGSGQLQTVENAFGHTLIFTYDADGHINTITTPGGTTYEYAYDTNNNLVSVSHPDTNVRTYHYENASFLNALTGITDENGVRYSTYSYDIYGWANGTQHAITDNGQPQEQYQLQYNTYGTQVVVTNPNGTQSVLEFKYPFTLGRRKLKKLTNQADGKFFSQTFDSHDNLLTRTDELGRKTTYTYNNNNQKTSITEASGTADARTTIYEYLSSDVDLVTSVQRPSVYSSGIYETAITYDADLNPDTVTQTGYTPNGIAVTRVADFDYDASGRMIQFDGPRTDVSDVTTFEYYACATGSECGQLKEVINGLGHITTYNAYDAHGRVTELTDANGIVTAYDYDNRGNLTSATVTPIIGPSRVTSYTYDDLGQLLTTNLPNGEVLSYAYDEAHDLRSITDNDGNKIEYSYDLAGNRTEDVSKDPSGTVKRLVTTTYDIRNRIDTINAAGSITDLAFDAVGNLTSETDPNLETTSHNYDPLRRLSETIDALSGSTTYQYDVHDREIAVQAPNGATTTYSYDDLGNLLQEVSPDRGTTIYSYDAAGNVVTVTDARGKVTAHTYDALNRRTLTQLNNGDTITFQYDTGTNAIGRLNKITDPTGQTTWSYDYFGAVTAKAQTIGSVTLTTGYAYDSAGRLTAVTLPSEKVVTYGYDDDLPISVTVDATTILSGATYDPFGPVNGWTWGNSSAHSRGYNLRGLLESQSMVTDTRTLTYDDAGYLITLDDARHDLGFDYDALGRLTGFTSAGSAPLPASQVFTYDGNSNRASITENGMAHTYSITANTNRLANTTGPTAKSFTYDAAGNVTSDNIHSYDYDDRGRLVSVDSGAVTYAHNGQGQRVLKNDGSATLFAYDEVGHLIGEYDDTGAAIQETVYFSGAPVAVLKGSDQYYVHTDHLGTPRIITDGNIVIWRWESDPFGTTVASEDPDGDLADFRYTLRFPGQYFDQETGLHYNYFRDYDPQTGRYITSDPIGLQGGLNTYRYANANPVRFVDPRGLESFVEGMGAEVPGGPNSGGITLNLGPLALGADTKSGLGLQGNAIPEVGAVIVVCEDTNECDAEGPSTTVSTPFFKVIGVTIMADGRQCFLFGLNIGSPFNRSGPLPPQGPPSGSDFTGG